MAITLTEAAADRVKQFLAGRDTAVGLRFGVRKSGCSGFAYVMDLADSVEPEDQVFETQDVKVVVDKQSLPYLEGTEIDFGGDRLSESFQFHNPNVRSECGCGESFGT